MLRTEIEDLITQLFNQEKDKRIPIDWLPLQFFDDTP